jgi:hypothetical protein
MTRATAARINRTAFEATEAELATRLAHLLDREPEPTSARQKEEGTIKRDLKEKRDKIQSQMESLATAATERVAAVTPAARARAAIFENPERFTALLAALQHVEASDVPHFAAMAADVWDLAAVAAVRRVTAERELNPEAALAVERTFTEMAKAEADLTRAVSELAVVRAEMAAVHAMYAASPAGSGDGFNEALTTHRAGTDIVVGDFTRKLSEADLDAAYQAVQMQRVTRGASWPAPEPGGTLLEAHADAAA